MTCRDAMSSKKLIWRLFSTDRETTVVNFGLKFTAVVSRISASGRRRPRLSANVRNTHIMEHIQ